MAELISGEPRIERGTRHVKVSQTPREHLGAHPSTQPPGSAPLTDQRIADDFFAAFQPYEPVVSQTPNAPALPENYETVVVSAPEKPPVRYTLPKRVVLTNEDGEEVYIFKRDTDVDGKWKKRPPKGKGPAILDVSMIYPDGSQNKGIPLKGIRVLRRGLLWNGQTAADIKKKPQ